MSQILPPPEDLPDAELEYLPDFLDSKEATNLFNELIKNTPWQADKIKVFGKIYDQPRLTALYAEDSLSYSYSGLALQAHPFTTSLRKLKQRLEHQSGAQFNSCLLNLYRNGQDSNGWHADNESELGTNPIIASLSLGANRPFDLKHRSIKSERYQLLLEHGSLLIMGGSMQHHWLHQIPKRKRTSAPRINLTFRYITQKTG